MKTKLFNSPPPPLLEPLSAVVLKKGGVGGGNDQNKTQPKKDHLQTNTSREPQEGFQRYSQRLHCATKFMVAWQGFLTKIQQQTKAVQNLLCVPSQIKNIFSCHLLLSEEHYHKYWDSLGKNKSSNPGRYKYQNKKPKRF